MATIYGLTDQDIIPAPGFSIRGDEKGGVTATHQYTMKAAAWNNSFIRAKFAKGKPISSIDPSVNTVWSFLTITDASLVHDTGEIITLSVNFSGSSIAQYGGEEGLGGDAQPNYRLIGSMSEAPFSEHPKWKALDKKVRNILGFLLDGSYLWDIDAKRVVIKQDDGTLAAFSIFETEISDIPNAVEFADRIAQGQTTYERPAITWTETTQGTDPMKASQLNKLSKISKPRGDPPNVTGSRNWRLTNASQDQNGDLYQTSIEWTLSEAEGHDSFLYE
jgi:hypothetical protein